MKNKIYEQTTNEYGFFDNPGPLQEEKLCPNMKYNIYVELVEDQDPVVVVLPEPIIDAKVINNKQNWIVDTLVAKKCMPNGMVWYLNSDGYHYAY